MSETPTSPEPLKPLDQIREERQYGVQMSEKIAQYLGLPVSGESLYDAMQEIFSSTNIVTGSADEKTEEKTIIDENIAQLNEISQRKTAWHELIKGYLLDPDMSLEDFDVILRGSNLSLRQIILDTIWSGVKQEAALQKVDKINSYHLPKNHALLAIIATEVSQEYAEEFFNDGRWKIIQETLSLPEKGINTAKTKAGQLVEKAKPALRDHLKGLKPEKQEKLFGRMVKFLSEDDLGKKLVEMADGVPGSTVVKGGVGSLRATASGVKEGLFSPLCACMMAVMLDGAEDKEKVFIQYVTFLVAGQLVQEGGKWVTKGGAQGLASLLENVAKNAPENSKIAKIQAFLKNGSPNKHLVLLATIALVVGAFQIPTVTDFVGDIANAIDENIPHGEMRELTIGGISAAAYLMQFSTKRFLPIAILVEGTQVVLDEVNPYAEQDEFLFDYITGKAGHIVRAGEQLVRDPLTAWNERVDEQKIPGNATQEAILNHSRIAHAQEWKLRTIVPFRQELDEYEFAESQLRSILQTLPLSPTSTETQMILSDSDKLRYREYALAGSDIWHTRDDIGWKILQRDPHDMSAQDKLLRYNPATGVSPTIARYMGWGNLSGRNDKALDRLDDVDGSVENRLDEFFEHECDSLIAREKNKCQRMISPGMGHMNGGYSPPQYVLDMEAYKKIEPWVKQMEAAKNWWVSMRATADALARKVVIARGLGVYDEKAWTAPGKEGNPLMPPEEGEKPTMAFDGMMYLIEERADILELAEPTTGRAARELVEMLGYEKPRYGTNKLSPTAIKEGYDADLKANPGIYQFVSLDRRDLALQDLARFAEVAFDTGVPIEYLQLALEPITNKIKNLSGYDPKTSDKEMWITPELSHTVQGNLAKYVLDHAAREGAISSGKMRLFGGPEIQVQCGEYTLQRTFVIKDAGSSNPQIRAHDVVVSEVGIGEMGERPPVQEFYHEWEPLSQYKNGLHKDLLTALQEKYASEKLLVEAEIQEALQSEKNIVQQELPKVWE